VPGVLLALLAACAAAPVPLQHVVLIKLQDPAGTPELLAECREKLPGIPGVSSCVVGQPVDLGRTAVDGDYDVGLVITFATPGDYQAYLEHPAHVALVAAWKPRWSWIRIHDFMPPP